MINFKTAILTIFVLICVCLLFFSCDTETNNKKKAKQMVVSGKVPVLEQKSPEKDDEQSEVDSAEVAAKKKAEIEKQLEAEHYDAIGKIDPFVPLVSAEENTNQEETDKPTRILTPLEKLDLGQIKLVAVISSKDKNLAMVEEASGKGYLVNVGTYIGRNSGTVDSIESDRIIIKETVKNFKGELKEQYREMKLHKQENGE